MGGANDTMLGNLNEESAFIKKHILQDPNLLVDVSHVGFFLIDGKVLHPTSPMGGYFDPRHTKAGMIKIMMREATMYKDAPRPEGADDFIDDDPWYLLYHEYGHAADAAKGTKYNYKGKDCCGEEMAWYTELMGMNKAVEAGKRTRSKANEALETRWGVIQTAKTFKAEINSQLAAFGKVLP